MIDIFIIGFLLAGLTHFLNYCMGKPASDDFSPYEIFSGYTVWLSKRRLIKVGLYSTYAGQYNDSLTRAEKKHEIIQLNNDFKKMLYNAADPFFTWERAVGMCPVCFGFWISLIGSVLFLLISNFSLFQNVVYLTSIIVISHIFIRIFNKII